MADRLLPLRDPAVRIAGSLWIALAAATGLVLLAGSGRKDPLLVWNASSSSPRGLYLFSPAAPRVGDFVVAFPPANATGLAEARGYLRSRVPLVKTVVAGSGARVCAMGREVRIDGKLVAVRLADDRAGRALPWWLGCRTLGRGELFLLGRSDPSSFDSRYFGPVPAGRVLGRVRLVWRA